MVLGMTQSLLPFLQKSSNNFETVLSNELREVLVQELDGHWSLYVVEPLKFGFVIRRNIGVKLGLAVNGFRKRASLVMIKFSLIRGK